uniref:Putative product n=1 Tax=Xenopsylla cheopis TaxID=163159 RepID=A0A6M2DPD2_XENCH
MKYTRYAFISYQSAEAAIKAFKETHSLSLESRSIIVRFRRHKGAVGLPGQSKTPGHLGEEATNSKIQGSNNEVKVKKTSISLTDDGVDLHDGPMEIDEDDYDIPYHDDLDDQYNSDFDDSLLDNISPNKESKKLIRDELPINRNLNTSHKGSSVPKPTKSMAKKDSSITVFEDPKKSKTNEPNASEAAKKNVEQKLGEILPNVLTQLLNSNEIKQEPFEKEYVEQLLQNQFVPEFASQLAAMAMGAIKSEPLVAELLLRKKPGKVPMPILCADEIKTEPVEQTDHEVTIPNLIPKTETPDSDDQDDFTDDYTNQRSTRRFREPMYKRLQKFKRYRPDNIPVNITQPEEPIEDFDMSYILDYISEEQAQFEELNKETTIHTTNYITSSFRPKSDETTSNMNNSSNVSTSQGFEISDTSSKLATAAFETSSPLLIRLPLAKPNEANTVESSSVSDSSCHLSSSLGTSLETKNQANIGATSPTKTPPPIGKPTAAVSPLITITDTQLAANLSSDNSLLSGRSSINSSQLSSISSSSTRLASQNVRTSISTGSSFLSSTTAHSVGTPVAVNSPVAAVSPLSHTNCDLSSNSGPSHMKNSNYSLTSLISGYNLPGNSSHIMSLLERSQHVSVSPNNSRSIKISNVVRNTKTKGLSAVISPQLPARSAAQSSKSTSNVLGSVYSQDKQSKVNISFDDFSEDEEDNTDYVALLGAPPPNLDDFINKT